MTTPVDPLIADLRRHREAAGMSQRQLAKACGTAQSHICAIERGLTTPGLEVLRRMGQVLGVQPSWEPLAYEADDAVARTLHVAEQTAATNLAAATPPPRSSGPPQPVCLRALPPGARRVGPTASGRAGPIRVGVIAGPT